VGIRRLESGQMVNDFRLEEPLKPGGMGNQRRVTREDVALPMVMKTAQDSDGAEGLDRPMNWGVLLQKSVCPRLIIIGGYARLAAHGWSSSILLLRPDRWPLRAGHW
jgi:hypothetical protein